MYETNNPVEDRFGFITRGTFRCSRATERISVIISLVITAVVFAGFYYVWGKQLIYIYGMHYERLNELLEAQRMGYNSTSTSHILFFALSFTFVTIIIVTGEIITLKIILNGVEYKYTADSNVFSFLSEKNGIAKTDIQYNDVIAVKYQERKLFGFIKRGFTVTVMTHSLGYIEFDYIFNKTIKIHTPENTPFNIIETRAVITGSKLRQI